MGEKAMHTEPFQSGQQTNAKDKGEKTVLKSNVSKTRNIGQPDPLAQAIKGRDSYIPSDMHKFGHTKASAPRGAHYNPVGEFGRLSGRFGSKATDYRSHSSRPGENALGVKHNLKGGNPLGSPQNKTGLNVMGGHGGSGTFRGRP